MSTLHERLLVEIERDQVDTCGGNTNSARDDGWWYAHAALRAVVELHREYVSLSNPIRPTGLCDECDPSEDYPCTTIRTIAEALDVAL